MDCFGSYTKAINVRLVKTLTGSVVMGECKRCGLEAQLTKARALPPHPRKGK
jgi:hypothetical protein